MPAYPHLPVRASRVLPVTVNAETPIPAGVLLTASFDGACSPNPGPMGVGYHIDLPLTDKGRPRVLVEVGAPIGQGTNNEAEWHALIALQRHALRLGFWELSVHTDSLLVASQYKGHWKARGRLKRLMEESQNLGRLFTQFNIHHTYREGNTRADALSHQLVFNEPPLPLPLKDTNSSRKPKLLQEWQAAAIRVWWHRHRPGAGTLSRIFGVEKPAIEAIAAGKSYRLADFTSYPTWIASLTMTPPTLDSFAGDIDRILTPLEARQ